MRLEDLIKRVRMSIAQVAVMDGASNLIPLGTGFLVGSGRYLVTAKHVIDAVPSGLAPLAGLAGVDEDGPEWQIRASFLHAPMTLIAEDTTNDLALLEISMPPDAVSLEISIEDAAGNVHTSGTTGPMKLTTTRPVEGAEIATSGFPLFAPSLVTTRGIIASTFAPLSGASVEPLAILCDLTAINGNSGGPVYRVSDGAVIGVCRAVKMASAGSPHSVPLLVATPVEHVIALMTANGIENVAPSSKPPSKRKRRSR